MKIGIDFTSAIYQRGVSRYTTNLAKALSKLPDLSVNLFGYSFRQHSQLLEYANEIPKANNFILPYPPKAVEIAWKFRQLKIQKFIPNLDVFHSWDWMQPPDTSMPIVSTIHDLAILKYPDTAHSKILKAHKRSWEVLKQRRANIIAVSRATKKDIITQLGYAEYLVHVIHEALPEEFKQTALSITQAMETEIANRMMLNKPYLLFVGTREPRKNLERLITAWQSFAQDYDLLIAGDEGWDDSSQTAQKFKHSPRFLGRVSDRELCVLYKNAKIFTFPSLYEGFGLPILESFYFGTPVLTSNNSGMVEVAGNAAELIDPTSITDIRKGIKTILNESQQEQQKRRKRMIIRQQMFSWKQTAAETVKVYETAIKQFSDNQK